MHWFHPLLPINPRLCTTFRTAPIPGKRGPARLFCQTKRMKRQEVGPEIRTAKRDAETLDQGPSTASSAELPAE